MGTKRQRECSLNCYKHWRSFPIREWVSYHLEVVVVVLDDLFILTGKSQISMVTPGFVTKVRLNQKCLKPLYHYKPLSSHCGWNLTLTLLFPPGQESRKVVYYFSQPWFLCRVQNACKVWDLLVRAKSKRNLRAGVELEKDYQIFLWGLFIWGRAWLPVLGSASSNLLSLQCNVISYYIGRCFLQLKWEYSVASEYFYCYGLLGIVQLFPYLKETGPEGRAFNLSSVHALERAWIQKKESLTS